MVPALLFSPLISGTHASARSSAISRVISSPAAPSSGTRPEKVISPYAIRSQSLAEERQPGALDLPDGVPRQSRPLHPVQQHPGGDVAPGRPREARD
jgi:hypothetical protein